MRYPFYAFLGACLLSFTACKKEVELVPTDRTFSWSEVKRLTGSQKIVVSMATNGTSLYLQHPYYLGVLTPSGSLPSLSFGYYGIALANLPSNINIRIPLNASFYATPRYDDQYLSLYPITSPVAFPNSQINIKELDPQAVRFITNLTNDFFQFSPINKNNYLLVGYLTNALYKDTALRFVLLKATVTSSYVEPQLRIVTIPLSSSGAGNITSITAIDDYFLVDCGAAGIYKILQDGTFKQVYTPLNIRTFYKWQGKVYGTSFLSGSALIVSSDDGNTWERYASVPNFFALSTFRAVGDSLVGITYGGQNNSIYTLRWQGATYRVRELKNDGLEGVEFTDLVQLGDTVYLGTYNGLFKRPKNVFFESKPQ